MQVVQVLTFLLILGLPACHSTPITHFPEQAEVLLADFQSEDLLTEGAYENLFLYFVQGFQSHRSPGGASAAFPGWRSRNGEVADGMEGFSRMAPLWGAWVISGRPSTVRLLDGQLVDLNRLFQRGLLAGTNPANPEYWGNIGDFDQRVCEASDIALSVWLFRDSVWKKLSAEEQRQVVNWLQQVNGKQIADNNWHLFITFVNAVLHSLGHASDAQLARENYERFKQFYRGDGWFSDGPGRKFDYYNAWGIHYQLFWLQQVDPTWDSEFLNSARRQFVSAYAYLLTPNGLPILGRSICYRMAAATPLILAQGADTGVDPGEARRALDVTWTYFIRHGSVRKGNVTQGYCDADERLVDNYSGPASCLWALRSLVVALFQPADSSFWTVPVRKLPVEVSDFSFVIDATGWTIRGERASGIVEIDMPELTSKPLRVGDPVLQDVSILDRMKSTITGKPHRPPNYAAKYERRKYLSNPAFCGCPNSLHAP